MSKFGSKEEIVKSIEAHFTQMQQGKLSMQELELLVEQARELYERVLVLRYKAYEEKVFGEAKEVLENNGDGLTFENQIELKEEQVEFYASTAAAEAEPISVSSSDSSEPVYDFSLFDKDESTEELPEVSLDQLPQEDEMEEGSFDDAQSTLEMSIEEEEEINQELEPEVSFSIDAVTTTTSDDGGTDIFDAILKNNGQQYTTSFMDGKLQTLLGAFGFNEKYQCIQELFKGSNDDFNQAIDVLDNLNNFDEAKKQLLFYVHLNNWNMESEITAEFVKKIERRYRA